GNAASTTFHVMVADRGPPVLRLQDMTVEASDLTGARVQYAPTAQDPEGQPTTVDCLPSATTPTRFPLGDTVVNCAARDEAGNETWGTFTVHVVDRTPPELTVPDPITVEALR